MVARAGARKVAFFCELGKRRGKSGLKWKGIKRKEKRKPRRV